MKFAPLNIIQLVLMALVVACPMAGGDWPLVFVPMQLTAAVASAMLGVFSLYATPIVPTSFLSATGIQTVHIVQGLIGAVLTTVNAFGTAHPSWGHALHFVGSVGGILMGVLGLFSPKAYNGPIMARRIRKIAAASAASMEPPPTPREGLPRS